MNVTINVTNKDFVPPNPYSLTGCAIARAIKRELGLMAIVTMNCIVVKFGDSDLYHWMDEELRILRREEYKIPYTFELELK